MKNRIETECLSKPLINTSTLFTIFVEILFNNMPYQIIHQATIVFTILCLLYTIACSKKGEEEKSEHSTLLSFSMKDIEKPRLNDIFSSIEIDTLEISDQSLIGRPYSGKYFIAVPHKYYIVTDNNYLITLFDTKGNFISNSANCIGEGPGEYSIMQDIAYNDAENTIEVLDPFSNIYVYDTNFNFLRKHTIVAESNDRFRRFHPLRKDFYALIDNTELSTFYTYNTKTKETNTIKYDGAIAHQSANLSPFQNVDGKLYFTPPEINNNIFLCDPHTGSLSKAFEMLGSDCLTKSDFDSLTDDPKETARYISSESNKYAQLNRFVSQQYIITVLLKQEKIYTNIYNRQTHNNRTFSKSSSFDENIPTCVHLQGDMMYGFVQPSEIDGFIDIDLVVNKEILETLEADDNPCVVKYKLKI